MRPAVHRMHLRSGNFALRIRFLLLLGLVLVTLPVACKDGGSPSGFVSGQPNTVFYEAKDGVHIIAHWELPKGKKKPPVVILLHQFEGSREQWKPLIPKLLDAGYAVLAPDLHGFGGSVTIDRDGKSEIYKLEDPEDLLLDAPAAIKWVSGRSEIDSKRIAVIGASVGANLAYVASGTEKAVKTAVAMSPSTSLNDDKFVGKGIKDFKPHSILFQSDVAESLAPQQLAPDVQDPVQIEVYPSADKVHGVALLTNPKVIQDILDWLKQTL